MGMLSTLKIAKGFDAQVLRKWGQIFWGRGTLAVSLTCGAKWRRMYITRFSPQWAVKNGIENFLISTSGLEL